MENSVDEDIDTEDHSLDSDPDLTIIAYGSAFPVPVKRVVPELLDLVVNTVIVSSVGSESARQPSSSLDTHVNSVEQPVVTPKPCRAEDEEAFHNASNGSDIKGYSSQSSIQSSPTIGEYFYGCPKKSYHPHMPSNGHSSGIPNTDLADVNREVTK